MKRKIKILFLIDKLWPGGTETQLILLAENLTRTKFVPVIGVLEDSEYYKKLRLKTPVIVFDSNLKSPLKIIHLLWKISRYIYLNNIYILQTFFNTSTILGAICVLLLKRRPIFISTRRNLYHWIEEEPFIFKILRLTSRWSDKVLLNSFAVYKRAQFLEAISKHKMEIIHNAIDIKRFNKVSSDKAKQMLRLKKGDIIVGVVANWRPVKGLVYFLKAARMVADKYPIAKFILAGFGPQKDELITLAEQLKIEQQTIFLDGQKSVDDIIPAFDIAVQPSLSESFSNVLLEYIAAGKPVVATSTGDANLIIKEGKGGFLVDPGDTEMLGEKILFLCNNKQLRIKMGEFNKKRVKDCWILGKFITKTEQLYATFENKR